jgi:hypothetical protein
MTDYIAQALGVLEIEDDAIIEYVRGLVSDGDMERSEKVEAICGMLSELTVRNMLGLGECCGHGVVTVILWNS